MDINGSWFHDQKPELFTFGLRFEGRPMGVKIEMEIMKEKKEREKKEAEGERKREM